MIELVQSLLYKSRNFQRHFVLTNYPASKVINGDHQRLTFRLDLTSKLTYNQTDNIETEALHRMTVSISIRPALEDRLAARARSTGKSLEDFIQAVLEREAALG